MGFNSGFKGLKLCHRNTFHR